MPANDAAGTDSLVRLIYRSTATMQPGMTDFSPMLEAILRQCWTHNPRHGITGALLFDGSFFLQVIEGGSGKVENLYEAIARDMRHEAIEVIDFLPTESREYAKFSMAFLDVTDARFPELQKVMSRSVQGYAPSLSFLIAEALAAAG